jgi:acetyltransferase
MSASIVEQLDHIFKPKSIAFIGASNDLSKWGGRVLNRTIHSDYRGALYPVNPKEKKILKLPAYSDIRKIPGPVDLAVFTVPAVHMPAVMKDCVEKGIRGGIVISADFAETGEKGRALEKETLRIAREGNMRFVGPNCNGVWSGVVGLNTTPDDHKMSGPVGFITQSGSFGFAATKQINARGFGFSKMISIGNQGDLTATDYLEYLWHDEETKVIAMYMEGFKDGQRFIEMAKQVVKQKPILILKGGRSTVGARATMSHTASIAGSDAVFDAVCRQSGLIRVHQLEHLFIMAEALFSQPVSRGKRVAIVGNGGQGVLGSDNLMALGMEIPEFSKDDQLRLKSVLPPHAPMPKNPVDFAAGGIGTIGEMRVIETLASFNCVDAIFTNVPVARSARPTLAERKMEIINAVQSFAQIPVKCGKPIVCKSYTTAGDVDEILNEANIPAFSSIESCTLALSALVQYGEIKRRY